MSQPTPIAIAVVEHQGRFLIGQRGESADLAGLWEFPGGKVKPGETPRQAAVRECLEETGLAIEIRGEFPSHVERYDHDCVHLHFFDSTAIDPAQQPHAPFRWVDRGELAQHEFPAGNRQLLQQLTSSS